MWSKLRRSGSKRSTAYSANFHDLQDDILLRDIEDLLIVWLDSNINRREDCIDTELETRRLIGRLKTFTDLNDCVNYLTSLPSIYTRVFLIVSGALGITLLERVHNVDAIVWIYIFCENAALHTKWASEYVKVKGIFTENALLLTRLLSDFAAYSVHLTPMRIFQADDKQKCIHDLNVQTASFMWFQLLIRIILTMCDNRDARAKKDLIDACLKRYEGDTYEQKRIKEFEETYTTGEAIKWYTKDSFLYRSVNRAFRSADIDIIYQFRFIIAEIHDQLSKLPRPPTSDLIVYRGQIISNADMQIIQANKGKGFISMNTFLSTSEIPDQAMGFCPPGMDLPNGFESVLFQITVGKTRQPFANIDAYSAIPSEKEVLFSVGTVFRIDKVKKYDSGSIVHLTLTTEVEERFDVLINHFMNEIGQSPTLATLGRFLIYQGDYNRAQRYFQFLVDVNGPDLDDIGRIICYTYLGYILSEKGEYEQAMDHYQQVLSIKQRMFGQDHPSFGETYSNIGTIHVALGQYGDAIKYFQRSLSIDLSYQSQNRTEISTTYNNLGQAYLEIADFPNAKANFEKALEKDEELGLNTIKHPDMAITYHNLGSYYNVMKEHPKAIEYYEKALIIQKASLPHDHPSRIITESSIAEACFNSGNQKDALEKYLSILDTKLKMRPPNFPSVAKTYMNLGIIYLTSGDNRQAKEQLKKASKICEHHLPKDHPSRGTNYQLLGDLYDAMGNTKQARSNYQQALDIFQNQKPFNSIAIGKVYSSLGRVQTNWSKGIEYAKQGLEVLLSVDSGNQETLAFAYNTLGIIHQHARQPEQAIENYTKALNLARQLINGNENDPSLSIHYHNLGSALGDQGDYEGALKYIHKALNDQLKVRDPLHRDMGDMYNELGSLYENLEKYDLALDFCQKAIDVYKQPNVQNHRYLARAYENIGSVYESLADWEKAVEYYKMALDLQLKEFGPDDFDLVSTYSSLGSVYEDREDYEMALTYFIPMLNIQQQTLSSSDIELAEDYERVGTCYHLNKNNQAAVKHYTNALEIRRQQKAPLTSIYHFLANAYKDLDELNTASQYYEMAIKCLNEEREKEENIDYYDDLCLFHHNLGVIQQRLNLFDKATENLHRSLAVYDEFLAADDKDDDRRRGILESIAKLHEHTDNVAMAKECRMNKEKATVKNASP